MYGQSFVDFTLSFTSTSVMFKHFAGGLVTTDTARPACSSLFFQGLSFLAQHRAAQRSFCHVQRQPTGAGWLTSLKSPGCRRSPAAQGRWADKGPLSLTAAGAGGRDGRTDMDVLGKGITMGQGYTDTYPHIPELTSLSHYLSLAPQKLKQTARFSSWLTAMLGVGSDSGLPR